MRQRSEQNGRKRLAGDHATGAPHCGQVTMRSGGTVLQMGHQSMIASSSLRILPWISGSCTLEAGPAIAGRLSATLLPSAYNPLARRRLRCCLISQRGRS